MDQLQKDLLIIRAFLQSRHIESDKVFVAGGAVRDSLKGKRYKDIDLYFETPKVANEVESVLTSIFGAELTTKFTTTIKIPGISTKVQLIKLIYGTPEEVINQFDFTVNAKYMKLSEYTPKSLNEDYSLRLLDKCKTPNTLLHRTLKLIQDGYEIETTELVKVLDKVKETVLAMNKYSLKNKDLIGSYYSPSIALNEKKSKGIKKVARKVPIDFTSDDIPF